MYACIIANIVPPPFQQKVGKTSASNARDLASSQANEQESNEIVTQIVLVICSAPCTLERMTGGRRHAKPKPLPRKVCNLF